MRKDQRLASAEDFAAVRRGGESWSDRLLVLLVRPNNLGLSRFGFSVGRRVGNAVVRNKIKRRLREVAYLTHIPGGWDLVIIARKRSSSADFGQLRSSLAQLAGRARVLGSPSQHSTSPLRMKRCGS